MSYKINLKKIYFWIIFSSFILGSQTMEKCTCVNYGKRIDRVSCPAPSEIRLSKVQLGHSPNGCEDAAESGCTVEGDEQNINHINKSCNGKSKCEQKDIVRTFIPECEKVTTMVPTPLNYVFIHYECVNGTDQISVTSSDEKSECGTLTNKEPMWTEQTDVTTLPTDESPSQASQRDGSSSLGLAIGITIAILLLIVGVTVFLVVYLKRKGQEKDDGFGTMTEQNNYIEIQDAKLDQNIKPFVNKTYGNKANGVKKDHNETLPEVNKNLTNDNEYHTINELETPGERKCNGSENLNQMEAVGAKSSSDCDYAKPLKQKKNGGMKKDDIPGKTTTEPTYLMMENDEYESSGNVINDMQGPLEPNTFGDTENGKTPGVSAVSVKNTEECDYDTPLSTNPPDFTDENVDDELNGSVNGAINTGKSIKASECSSSGSNTNNIEKTETENVDMMVENDEYQTSDDVDGYQNGPPQEEPQYFILEDSNTGENDEVTMVENNYYTSSEVTGPEEPKPEENPYML